MPLLHELVARVAHREPSALAVVDGPRRLTFGELHEASARIAAGLRARGVGRGERVAVTLRRRAELIAVVLGVLRAGAAFVPSDARTPARRLGLIAQDAAVRLVVAEPDLGYRDAVRPEQLLDSPASPASPDKPLTGTDLAYVLYTSGSTGRPKGVAISHDGITGYLTWAADFYAMRAGTGAPLFTSLGFDLTLTSMFGPLLAGRAVTVVPESGDLVALADLLRTRPGFSFVKLTPHHLDLLTELLGDDRLDGALRCLIVGGDALWRDSVRSWLRRAPGTRVVNEYGPTETVVGCAVYEVPAADGSGAGQQVPIGGPVAGARLHVLDPDLRPVAGNAAGELYVGGACATGWYLDRPARTAERFVPDPSGPPGARMYRTGDRARYGDDGQLEYLGRADSQVKVRGFRVEPAEVQAVLRGHPEGRDAVVFGRGAPGGVELIAAVAGATDPDRLRGWLAERLPDWMVPARILAVDALPLTVNGKVDRAALDRLAGADETPADGGEAEPPRTAAEELLAGLMAQVLHRDTIGREENFFALGGDSIRGIQLVARARKAGLQISPRHVADHPTAAGLAAVAVPVGGAATTPAAAGGPVPLTPIQRWFFDLDLPEPAHWNQAVLLDLPPGTDPVALRQAVDHATADRDALCLRYERAPDGWTQRLADGPPAVAFDIVEPGPGMAEDRAQARQRAVARAHAGLDLRDGPLMRVVLLRGAPGEGDRLMLVAHHLVVDTVSWHLLVDDLAQAYQQLCAGRAPAPLPRPGRFADWARACAALAARPGVVERVTRTGAPVPVPVPRDDPGAANDLAGRAEMRLTLAAEHVDALVDATGGYDVRLHEVLLGAFVAAVCEVLGCAPAPVDVEGHGREDVGQELDVSRTVGWFTALFPVHLGADREAAALVRAARDAVRAAPLAGLGYGLARYLARVQTLAVDRHPELLFNYLGRSAELVSPALGWRLSDEPSGPPTGPVGTRPYLIEYHPAIVSGALRSTVVYHPACHRPSTVDSIATGVDDLLRYPGALLASVVPEGYGDAGLAAGDLQRILARYSGGRS